MKHAVLIFALLACSPTALSPSECVKEGNKYRCLANGKYFSNYRSCSIGCWRFGPF
jgi:hypothetical protein